MKISGTYAGKSWDETTFHTIDDNQKLNEATVTETFSGDMVGETIVRMQLLYTQNDTAHYHGYRLFKGTLNGQSGSVVILETGLWSNENANSKWEIVSGSGTGAFAGKTGTGGYETGHAELVNWTLNLND